MRIPDEKIDEVRTASDIVDVISAYVSLKKRGKNYTGLCPFHQEKTPSFSVSAEKQMYYCFGCGAGGNVFTFLMQHDKLTFLEAVRTLAERAGIALPEESPAAQAQATEQEALYHVTRTAALFFYDQLIHTAEGAAGLQYFRGRGFTDETIKKFGLGYSLNAWDGLLRHAAREKLDPELLERGGLLLRREEGPGYYDRFRGRAMFPIFSPGGKVIAFGARKLRDDDKLAKYINSPETPIYNKSRVLYGLSHAKEAIREQDSVVLVEGYADLITSAQAGILNIVASSGTALTEEQIRLIDRYTHTVVLVYDADSAGSKAMLRGVDLVIEQGLEVKVTELPEGEDPDSFVRKNGGKSFQELIDRAGSFLDFKANYFRKMGLLATAEGKVRAIRSIVGTLAHIHDELRRNVYLQQVASLYSLPEGVIRRELEASLGRASREMRRVEGGTQEAGVRRPSVRVAELPAGERDTLRVMLEHGDEIIRFVFTYVDPAMFTHPEARVVADRLAALVDGGGHFEPSGFLDALGDDALRGFVSSLMMQRYDIAPRWSEAGGYPETPDPLRLAEDAVVGLRVRELDRLIELAHGKFRELESHGEDTADAYHELRRLQEEKRTLVQSGFRH
jgi:DNA primase